MEFPVSVRMKDQRMVLIVVNGGEACRIQLHFNGAFVSFPAGRGWQNQVARLKGTVEGPTDGQVVGEACSLRLHLKMVLNREIG